MKKITPLQLCFLMIGGRFFSMMTYLPYTHDNALVLMIGTFISTALQAVMIIPLLFFGRKFGSDNVCTLAMCKNKAFGFIVTGGFLLYFLWDIFMVVGNFGYFMDYYFSNYLARFPVVFILCAGAIYIGKMNITVIGRFASILFFIFMLFTIIIVLNSLNSFTMTNFHLADKEFPHSLFTAIKSEFVRNRNLVFFAFLLPEIKGSKEKCIYTYFALKIIILEVVIGFITVVLGNFSMITKLPFFYLAAYSNSELIERYDTAFLSIWTVMAVLKLGTIFHCTGKCLKILWTKIPDLAAVIIGNILPALVALYYLTKHRWEELAYFEESIVMIITLTLIIPLIMLFFRKGRVEQNAVKQSR